MKLKSKNRKIWFASDYHLYHKNITFGVSNWDDKEKNCRNFQTVEEMTNHIIDQINKYVGEDDILFFLGDFSFDGVDKIWEGRKRIKVKEIHFIKGNHDEHIKNDKILPNCHRAMLSDDIIDGNLQLRYNDGRDDLFRVSAQELFTSVQDFLEIFIDNIPVMMFHRPIEDFHDHKGKVIHIHGHSHGRCPKKENRLDVGIDNAYELLGEYRPFSWEDVIKFA